MPDHPPCAVYEKRVEPHHTDYAGVVWHGAYVAWLEEARIAALRSVGIEFADLVAANCDLPVVDLSLKYKQSLRLGDVAQVRSRLVRIDRIRLLWSQDIFCSGQPDVCVMGKVLLVPVDRVSQRVIRRWQPPLIDSLRTLGQLHQSDGLDLIL